MRLFGAQVGRPKTQAYVRTRGGRSSLATFRGPASIDYETLGVPDAYGSPIVYGCVHKVSSVISQLPRKVRRETDNKKVTAPMWVENPNSFQGGNDFVKCLVASLMLWGEAFIVPKRNVRQTTVEAAVLNPQYVWHQTSGGVVRWSVNGLEYDGELVHLRNDVLPAKVRGVAAVNIMAPLIETNRVAQKFIYNVVEQGGAYQLAVMFPDEVSADAMQDTIDAIVARHAGPDGAYKPLMLSGGATVEVINQSNADSGFIDLSDQTAKQIAQFQFGIDDTMLGFKSDQPQVYQNAPSVHNRFWTFACKHIAGEIEKAMTYLLPRGLRFDFEEWDFLLGGPHDRAKMALEMANVNSTLGAEVFEMDEIRKTLGMVPLPEYRPLGQSGGMIPEPPEAPMLGPVNEMEDDDGEG